MPVTADAARQQWTGSIPLHGGGLDLWAEGQTRNPGAIAAACVLALLLAAYWESSPYLLWSALLPALWLAAANPARLVQLLLVTTPAFPVIRMAQDFVGAQQVSTKGLFFSADDPIILALLFAWAGVRMRHPGQGKGICAPAFGWLIVLYPCVILLNGMRLDSNQLIVTTLYYLKWLQYVVLLIVVPQTIAEAAVPRLMSSLRRLLIGVVMFSTLFAVYEMAEAVRTGSYSSGAAFPRASAFFGTLDPARFAASEDPVNFGVYSMVAGAIALGMFSHTRSKGRSPVVVAILASGVSLLLSASRTPWLAAIAAFVKIQRIRSSKLIFASIFLAVSGALAYLIFPELWSVTASRFGALSDWQNAMESSATDRLAIALNSPVFEVDEYWLAGHGHSSYRFIAEEHLSTITRGISRSLYNFLLTAWYDVGPLGAGLWILAFLQLLRTLESIAAGSVSDDVRALAWGLRGALWGICIASMFGEAAYNWRVMGYFYLCTGICLAADQYHGRLGSPTERT